MHVAATSSKGRDSPANVVVMMAAMMTTAVAVRRAAVGMTVMRMRMVAGEPGELTGTLPAREYATAHAQLLPSQSCASR
jgi:hypothetical protein